MSTLFKTMFNKLKRKQAPLKSTCSSSVMSNMDDEGFKPKTTKRYNGPAKKARFNDDNIVEGSDSPPAGKTMLHDMS